MSEITIYTDGSCLANRGVGFGGWAAYFRCGKDRWLLSGAQEETMSYAMELTAIREALRSLKSPKKILIFCDCKPIVVNMNERIASWAVDGFHNRLFSDLYRDIWDEIQKHERVRFKWIRSHNGIHENELVDHYAGLAAEGLRMLKHTEKKHRYYQKLSRSKYFKI